MQRYRVVIMMVLFGVLPVVATFFLALSYLEEQESEPTAVAPVAQERPRPKPPDMKKVIAAARTLPVSTLLGNDDLTIVELDPADVPEESILMNEDAAQGTTPGALRGYAVREAIGEGVPLSWPSIVGPGQRGFLAAALRPGSRAVTIRVGDATSHAGLIDPGDHVDVILSAELAIAGGERNVFARTIADNVRVVAIDRRVEGEDGEAERTEMTTATLEASPAQADRLVLGEHEGRLSLAVRSLAASTAAGTATQAETVELREMLLSSPDFKASEARLERVRELSDLSSRKELVESRKQLRAAIEAGTRRQDAVRISRGAAPAEEVVFERP